MGPSVFAAYTDNLIIFTNSKAVYSHGEEVVGQGSSAMALELLLCREDGIRAEEMVAYWDMKKIQWI